MALLKDHHKQKFNATNQRLGLQQNEYTFDMNHKAFGAKNEVVFSADPANGDIIGKVVPVASIAELKKLTGVPATEKDDHIQYPQALSKMLKTTPSVSTLTKENAYLHLDKDTISSIRSAAAAYVTGDAQKVADYEGLINATMFPGQAVLFSAPDLYIKNGQTVVFGASGDPEIHNYGTITVEAGGKIQIVGNTSVTCQVFTQL